MLDTVILLLIAASGICWSVVYIDSIRIGFREKTYAMPLFALGLNIAWEGIYAYTDLFVRHEIGAQAIANTCWFLLDILIVVTYFKYAGRECRTEMERKLLIPWSVLVLVICFVLQLLFLYTFGDVEGEKYSAYLQNVAMSAAFLYFLRGRGSSRGQSMTIAVCKCIGTLTPTIYGTIEGNCFITVTGLICLVLDLLYIGSLRYTQKRERMAAAA
ncbi:MAG: hypothetical protein ACI3VN_10755 [Candidatus Onthomonas sp.]